MDSQAELQPLHFVLFPFMAQGHMIPMIDIARILARRGLTITIVTTPLNASRFESVISRDIDSGLSINLVQIQLPLAESGLPDGYENMDMLDVEMVVVFFKVINSVENQVEKLFQELKPQPSCIIADMCLPYTSNIAKRFNIPKIVFHGMCCFCLLCMRIMRTSKILDTITSESDYFNLPGLPGEMEFTRSQLPVGGHSDWKGFSDCVAEADYASFGVIVNTFQELEPEFIKQYKKVRSDKVWCIGPVSLCNKKEIDKLERGNKFSVDKLHCMRWLDSQETNSVLYVCLGSLCNLPVSQLIELGLGLEASSKHFIWVVRDWENSKALKQWIFDTGFENRIKDRGILIKGWAPQVLILSHPSVGGFLTHCGWNSTLEGITAGRPLLTWPLFGDQFCNEKLVVQVLKVGVPVGVKKAMKWGQEETIGVLVSKEDVKLAVEKVMDKGEEGENRRKNAKRLLNLANQAVEEGGSSYVNTTMLIQDIISLRERVETLNEYKFTMFN